MQVHKTAVLNHAPEIGIGTSIGEYCVIQNYKRMVRIGEYCDIAARVSINCSDSHLRCIGLLDEIQYLPIFIEDHVYIGEGAIILGGCTIGHHSVIGAGVVMPKHTRIPPYSLVTNGPLNYLVKEGHYDARSSNKE